MAKKVKKGYTYKGYKLGDKIKHADAGTGKIIAFDEDENITVFILVHFKDDECNGFLKPKERSSVSAYYKNKTGSWVNAEEIMVIRGDELC